MRLNPTRRPSPRATTASLIVLSGCLILATPTLAQQRVSNPGDGRTPGMRYLTWPGKNEAPRSSRAVTTPTPAPEYQPEYAPEARPEVRGDDEPRGPILSMPSQPLVSPVATRYSARTSPGPTPASAWISNGGVPTSASRVYAEPTDAPPAYAPPAYDPTPTSAFVPAPPLETAVRARNLAPSYEARVATLPEPPRGYAPVVPLDAPAPHNERVVETPVYDAPTYETPPVEPPPYEAPRYERPVAADTGPAAIADAPPAPVERVAAPPPPAPAGAPPVETTPVETPPSTPAVDPYAPRADAPIFRLLNRNSQPAPVPEQPAPAPEPAASTARTPPPAPQQSAQAAPQPYPAAPTDVDRSPRRYSVHRGNGQSPDRVPLPDPVMLDSAPVDLAEPPETPTVIRNVNGRLTAITPSSEDPAQP